MIEEGKKKLLTAKQQRARRRSPWQRLKDLLKRENNHLPPWLSVVAGTSAKQCAYLMRKDISPAHASSLKKLARAHRRAAAEGAKFANVESPHVHPRSKRVQQQRVAA